jgi:hypothetical protein
MRRPRPRSPGPRLAPQDPQPERMVASLAALSQLASLSLRLSAAALPLPGGALAGLTALQLAAVLHGYSVGKSEHVRPPTCWEGGSGSGKRQPFGHTPRFPLWAPTAARSCATCSPAWPRSRSCAYWPCRWATAASTPTCCTPPCPCCRASRAYSCPPRPPRAPSCRLSRGCRCWPAWRWAAWTWRRARATRTWPPRRSAWRRAARSPRSSVAQRRGA